MASNYPAQERLMSDFLNHPFVLLLTGALLSGLLIPSFTRRWQNHQKILELKTELVSEVSESTMKLIMAVQSTHISIPVIQRKIQKQRHKQEEIELSIRDAQSEKPTDQTEIDQDQWSLDKSERDVEQLEESISNSEQALNIAYQELNAAYREWEVRSAVIGTKLQAYFPARGVPEEKGIPEEWSRFSEAVGKFYALEGVPEEPRRRELINEILSIVGHSSDQENVKEWNHLRKRLLFKKTGLVQDILNASSPVIEPPGPLDRLLWKR
jgi:hypothetical protein